MEVRVCDVRLWGNGDGQVPLPRRRLGPNQSRTVSGRHGRCRAFGAKKTQPFPTPRRGAVALCLSRQFIRRRTTHGRNYGNAGAASLMLKQANGKAQRCYQRALVAAQKAFTARSATDRKFWLERESFWLHLPS